MEERERESRFREIFRRAHADHAGCAEDEWLMVPCRGRDVPPADRSLVWSRRNGPWRRVDVLWVGAAPGNAGGMGSGTMGAHGTRIPFGGDIAGANLDLLLAAAGLDRNTTFIVASLNQLPDRGGGEPTVSELRRPVGEHPSSVHLLRETLIAAGPRLVIALGNVGLRTTMAAATLAGRPRLTLPGLSRIEEAGLRRGEPARWPAGELGPDEEFLASWEAANGSPLPQILWLLHPSAQNMSPFARPATAFHQRMVETRSALRAAMAAVFGPAPEEERVVPWEARQDGIYGLPEWGGSVGPRHAELIRLWREKGV